MARCLESRWLARQQCRRLGELPSLPLVYVCVGAGDGIRTRDILLGRIMSAPLNLFQAPRAVFGPSWPPVSKTLGHLSPTYVSAGVAPKEVSPSRPGCIRGTGFSRCEAALNPCPPEKMRRARTRCPDPPKRADDKRRLAAFRLRYYEVPPAKRSACHLMDQRAAGVPDLDRKRVVSARFTVVNDRDLERVVPT